MSTAYNQNQIVEGKISMAIQRLAERFPFHAGIAERFQIRPCPEVETMAVTIKGDSIPLLYCADFVARLTLPELEAVLQHEVHHVVFGHVLVDPANYPDAWARTVAEEVTVNEFIKDPLPAGAITLESFPKLRPMESTDDRYARLRTVKRRKPIGTAPSTVGRASRGPPSPPRTPPNPPPGKNPAPLATIDNHEVWASGRKDPQQSAKVIQAVVRDVVNAMGAEEIPEWLRGAIEIQGIGKRPSTAAEQLQGDRVGKQNWVQTLRRYVGQSHRIRHDFLRPPRRFPHLAGLIPGRRHRAMRPRILAAIDTSASLDTEMLEVISAELARLARNFQVTVVECDAKIQRVYPFKPIKTVHGRGGTDLRPPFRRMFLRKLRPDMLIYFTDGAGPAPKRRPVIPVIWCLTQDGERPAPWGRTLKMGSGDGK